MIAMGTVEVATDRDISGIACAKSDKIGGRKANEIV
jgi:hypothetical protein